MSLKYGLIVKNKAAPVPVRRPVLDEDDEDDEDHGAEVPSLGRPKPGQPPRKPLRKLRDDGPEEDLSSIAASRAHVKAAEELDASIFDYDSFHDAKTSVSEAKKAAERQDAVERKPKYINNLLDAAARRKQDQLIAREKLLQKEREAEGDEFAGKDKFVTTAYKQQQEEARRLEAEEKVKAEEDEKRKRAMGGGMQSFYKSMMDQSDRQHQEAVEAAAKVEAEGGAKSAAEDKAKSDAELAAELKAKGVNVHINEEGQVTDKRELLSAGLNVAPSGKPGDKHGADHLRTSNRPAQPAFQNKNASSQQAQRERQTKMMEEQLAAQAKRAREEDDEEKARLEQASKTQKTGKDVSDAKARFLARKAAKERGEG
ncbi:hypothetical protein LTR36_001815 [Oleoguttula mirabilis]|uniref:Nuclear speckle splicing regulatory protein 1 N-terminal domain-containing protein n=1 Tax=Oleoguttula mirabilis TaxID=1507867 RepID=A0AAV9JMV0_9PEZI|nr:hypothetical protein LTR36_001815 [Oleoguttula mirabilis]